MAVARIRRARPDEAELLRELAHRSKAHWGYDADFLETVRPLMQLSADQIRRGDVFVIEEAEGVIGWYRLTYPRQSTAELEDLWVAPEAIGTGRGRALWDHLVVTAQARGARCIEWDADPFARGFYEAVGGRVIGQTASTLIPGRFLPRMRADIA